MPRPKVSAAVAAATVAVSVSVAFSASTAPASASAPPRSISSLRRRSAPLSAPLSAARTASACCCWVLRRRPRSSFPPTATNGTSGLPPCGTLESAEVLCVPRGGGDGGGSTEEDAELDAYIEALISGVGSSSAEAETEAEGEDKDETEEDEVSSASEEAEDEKETEEAADEVDDGGAVEVYGVIRSAGVEEEEDADADANADADADLEAHRRKKTLERRRKKRRKSTTARVGTGGRRKREAEAEAEAEACEVNDGRAAKTDAGLVDESVEAVDATDNEPAKAAASVAPDAEDTSPLAEVARFEASEKKQEETSEEISRNKREKKGRRSAKEKAAEEMMSLTIPSEDKTKGRRRKRKKNEDSGLKKEEEQEEESSGGAIEGTGGREGTEAPAASAGAPPTAPATSPPPSSAEEDVAVALPPNALYRFLLSLGRPGHVVVSLLVLIAELIHNYLPFVESIFLYLLKSLRIYDRDAALSRARTLAARDRARRERRARGEGLTGADTGAEVNLQYTGFVGASGTAGGRRASRELRKKADEAAVEKMRRVGDVREARYRHLSKQFMRRHGLGKYRSEKEEAEEELEEEAESEEVAYSRDMEDEGLIAGEGATDAGEVDTEDDWVVQALREDNPPEEKGVVSLGATGDAEDGSGKNFGFEPSVTVGASSSGRTSVGIGFDFTFGSPGRRKKRSSSSSASAVLEAAAASRGSSSAHRRSRSAAGPRTSDRDGGGGVLGRIRHAVGTNAALSGRILGAYPGDAVPIEEAASADGVTALARRYGYGDWSEDEREDEREDDGGGGGGPPVSRPRSRSRRGPAAARSAEGVGGNGGRSSTWEGSGSVGAPRRRRVRRKKKPVTGGDRKSYILASGNTNEEKGSLASFLSTGLESKLLLGSEKGTRVQTPVADSQRGSTTFCTTSDQRERGRSSGSDKFSVPGPSVLASTKRGAIPATLEARMRVARKSSMVRAPMRRTEDAKRRLARKNEVGVEAE